MVKVASGFSLWSSDRNWTCDCGNLVGRGDEYAVRLRDNEEMCMGCYEDETGHRSSNKKKEKR